MIPLLLACASPDPSSDTAADTGRSEDVESDTSVGSEPSGGSGEPGTLWVNEFVAFGASDGFAAGADWIELRNAGARDWDLSRTTLWVDDGTDQLQWMFPSGTRLGAGELLVVVCDETNGSGDELHATFRIGRQGGTIYLSDAASGEHEEWSYGYQATGISAARSLDGLEWTFDKTPTPGAAND